MFNGKVRQWNPVTISIPDDQLFQIDDLRHDVSRSEYIQRVLEDLINGLVMNVELSD